MEAEVAPKSTAMAFVVISFLEAGHFLFQATVPVHAIIGGYRGTGRPVQFVAGLLPTLIALVLAVLIALVLGLLFARRLVKMREVRPEPNPRIWATVGGSALLVLALQLVSWGMRPLVVWTLESMDYISYDRGGWMLDIAIMSKGLGPAFLLILAGLFLVVCFGMTRPRIAFLDEDHEVWGKETAEEAG